MAVRPILLFPDPRLSQPSPPVTKFDASLSELIKDLTDTMRASPGVGLAAPQIGIFKQVSVIEASRYQKGKSMGRLVVLINPRLIEAQGEQVPREGCLSVPDFLANIRRKKTVVVETRDANGGTLILTAYDFEALAFQHEIDHLNGTLFLDRVSNIKTDVFRRKSYSH